MVRPLPRGGRAEQGDGEPPRTSAQDTGWAQGPNPSQNPPVSVSAPEARAGDRTWLP